MHVIASVATYDQLRDALRERRLELGLTQLELDYLSGVRDGWTGKAECSAKRYGNLRSDESSRPQIAAAINHPQAAAMRHLPTSVALSVGLWSTCVIMAPLSLFK